MRGLAGVSAMPVSCCVVSCRARVVGGCPSRRRGSGWLVVVVEVVVMVVVEYTVGK